MARLPDETSLEEDSVFDVFDGRVRQRVIQSLLSRPTATLAELAELADASPAMISRHVVLLEDLGILALDVPKGARRGRTVNVSLNRHAYSAALQQWLRHMGAGD